MLEPICLLPLALILIAVEDARDLDSISSDFINDDVRQWRKYQLTPPKHPNVGSSKFGKILQSDTPP
jgi:hypothetical protein